MTNASGLIRVGQIAINVHDLERAVRFYRDTLGLKFLFQAPRLAFFECGGVRLMLSPPEKPEFDHAGSILYYQVADIKATHAELVGRGVKFEDAPHVVAPLGANDLWMTFCHDSEGNLLALMSEVPR
jgi:predicted enzyme related to lactoylglutathione lyase